MITDVTHHDGGIAKPTVVTNPDFREGSALLLNWPIYIAEFVLFASAENMYATPNQRVFADRAFANVALRANIHSFLYSGIPVGQYCEESDRNIN